MAAVIREKWGSFPSFIKTHSTRNLFDILAPSPNLGKGLRVTPTLWYRRGWHDCYYTITDVQFDGVSLFIITYIYIYIYIVVGIWYKQKSICRNPFFFFHSFYPILFFCTRIMVWYLSDVSFLFLFLIIEITLLHG